MNIFGVLFLLLLVGMLVTVIVAFVKAGRSMGWPRILFGTLLFLSSILFLYLTAVVGDRRLRWQQKFAESKEIVEQLENEVRQLKIGDLYSSKSDDSSLSFVLGELTKMTIDRGRVWRHADLVNSNGDNITIQTVGKDEQAPQEVPPQSVVYGFGEERAPDGQLLPTVYLGEFNVVSSTNGLVELQPTSKLLDSQRTAIQNGLASQWTIYELMPLDSHLSFVAPGSEPNPEELFGRMDEGQLSQLLEIDTSLVPEGTFVVPDALVQNDQERLGALLSMYINDGKRVVGDQDLPDGTLWIRVRFTKSHSIEVDSLEERSALDGNYFDLSGRTVDSRLKRGEGAEAIEFSEGDEIVIIEDSANELIDREVAVLVDRYFVRSLTDYQDGFAKTAQLITEARQNIAWVTRENELAKQLNARLQRQSLAWQQENALLNNDLAQYELERQVITQFNETLEQELVDVRTQIKQARNSIAAAHRKLIERQRSGNL